MKLNEAIQLQEAKFSSPVIMYHGTSSKNLRTILSQGLHDQKVGSGFGGSQGGGAMGRDMAAIGGVYLTTSIRSAQSAASSVTNRSDNSVIVVVSVQPQSGYADEDDIDSMIGNVMGKYGTPKANLISYLESKTARDNPIALLKRFPEQIQMLLKKQPRTSELIIEIKQSYLARSLAYDLRQTSAWSTPPKYIMADEMNIRDPDEIEFTFNNLLEKIGTPQEAERRYRTILERLTVALKRFAYDTGVNDRALNDGPLGSSLRIPSGIGYSGNNKIIGVIEVDDDNDAFIVHYDRGGVRHLQNNETMDVIFGVSDTWIKAR